MIFDCKHNDQHKILSDEEINKILFELEKNHNKDVQNLFQNNPEVCSYVLLHILYNYMMLVARKTIAGLSVLVDKEKVFEQVIRDMAQSNGVQLVLKREDFLQSLDTELMTKN